MKNTLYSIQALRGIAAVMVLTLHAQALMHTYETRIGLSPALFNSTTQLRVIGASGVDLFFVISGFIMAYVTCRKRESRAYIRPFLKRRLVRIAPVYWLYTSIMAALLFFFPHLYSTAKFSLSETILSYLFIPYNPVINHTAPIIGVGWTLWYEMYFYLLVAVGLCLSFRSFALALGVFFGACVFLLPALQFSGPIATLVTNPILLEFYAGFICGGVYLSDFIPHRIFPPMFLFSGIAGYVLWGAGLSSIPLGYFAVLIVTGSIFWERQAKIRLPSLFVALGDSSYTLYLSHYLLLPALGKFCTISGFWSFFSPDAFIMLAVVTCVSAGHILYVAIEKPLIRRLSA